MLAIQAAVVQLIQSRMHRLGRTPQTEPGHPPRFYHGGETTRIGYSQDLAVGAWLQWAESADVRAVNVYAPGGILNDDARTK